MRVLKSLVLSAMVLFTAPAFADDAAAPATVTAPAAPASPLAAFTSPDAPPPDVLVELPGFPFPVPSGVAGWITFLASVGFAFSLVCRSLSDALFLIAKKTKTDTDDKAADALARAAGIMASFFGHFGAGTPKPMLAAKIAEAAKNDDTGKTVSGDGGSKGVA